MSEFARVKDIKTLERYEDKLKDLYEKFTDQLRGQDLTAVEQKPYHDEPHARIDPFELRLAIDNLITVLKDIKKIAK